MTSGECKTSQEILDDVLASGLALTGWEKEFVAGITPRLRDGIELSEGQRRVLDKMWDRSRLVGKSLEEVEDTD